MESKPFKITVPMKAHIFVPRPVDADGNPLPVVYDVMAVSACTDPAQMRRVAEEGLAQRVAQYAALLRSRSDPDISIRLDAVREFVDLVLSSQVSAPPVVPPSPHESVSVSVLPGAYSAHQTPYSTPRPTTAVPVAAPLERWWSRLWKLLRKAFAGIVSRARGLM